MPVRLPRWMLSVVVVAACSQATPQQHDDDHLLAFFAEDQALADQLIEEEGGWRTPVFGVEPGTTVLGIRFEAGSTPPLSGRYSEDDGRTWSEWLEAEIRYVDRTAHNAYLSLTATATRAQLRFGIEQPDAVTFLIAESFGAGDPVIDEVPLEELPDLGAMVQQLAGTGVAVPRSEWGARQHNCSSQHTANRMTVHHTVSPTNDSLEVPARVRQIQSYHMDAPERKYCDVGYHFLVGRDGRVYEGRPERLVGAHVGGNNTSNLGVSFIGTFTSAAPSSAMMDAGAAILRSASDHYSIALNRTQVRGHREYSSTECPGDSLYPLLGHLLELAAGSGGTGPAPTGVLRGYVFWGTDFNTDVTDPSKRIANAAVRVSGGPSTTTASDGSYLFDLAAGTYSITVEASGYSSQTLSRAVTAGQTTWGSVMLTPASTTGSLRVDVHDAVRGTSVPVSGAFVDVGVPRVTSGYTNASGRFTAQLAPGTYDVTVTATGYHSERGWVTILAGATSERVVPMSPVVADPVRIGITRPAAASTVETSPVRVEGWFEGPGVHRIEVNGRSAGISAGTFAVSVDLAEGPNVLRAIASSSAGTELARTEISVTYVRPAQDSGGGCGCAAGGQGGPGALVLLMFLCLVGLRRMAPVRVRS